jgi:hypothetical protein
MLISAMHAMLMAQNQPTEVPVNQSSYAELDEIAVPEFSRLYMPVPDGYVNEGTTAVISPSQSDLNERQTALNLACST